MTLPRSGRNGPKTPKRRRSAKAAKISADQLLAVIAAKDLDTLIDAAFDALRSAVASDFVSAFYRSSTKGTLKERDSRGRQYGPAFMRRYMELTPAIPLARATPGVKILPTRAALPRDEELRKLPFYREIMQTQGWRHGVALCFWSDPPGELPVFVITVYRTERRRDFSATEVARLESIHPFIDNAVKSLHERDTAKSAWDGLARTVHARAFGLAILDRNLRLVEANAIARRLCAAWVDDVSPRGRRTLRAWRLPPPLEQLCRDLHDEWQSQLQVNPDAPVLRRRSGMAHPGLKGVTASITMVCRNATALSEPSFVLEFEKSRASNSDINVLRNLTAAERVVALAVRDGRSNQEVADHLAKTVEAVKFLLHRVYQKTGLPNRAALAAALRN